MNFYDNPRYQRAAQRIAAIPQSQQAILRKRYANLDAYFAGQEAGKGLDAMARKSNTDYLNKRLNLARLNLSSNTALQRDKAQFLRNQDVLSTGVGLVEAGVAAKTGRDSDAVRLQLARRILGMEV